MNLQSSIVRIKRITNAWYIVEVNKIKAYSLKKINILLVDTRSLSEVSQISLHWYFRSNWQFVAWFCAKLEVLCEVSQIFWYDIVVLSQFCHELCKSTCTETLDGRSPPPDYSNECLLY